MSPNRLQAKPPDLGTSLHATLKQPKNPIQEFPGNVCLEGWHKAPKFHEDLISESNTQVTSSAISSALLSLQAVGEH